MKTALYLLFGVLALLPLGGCAGLFAGTRPSDLGVTDGRLKPPSLTRNSVSSQADLHPEHPQRDYARIEPLPLIDGDPQRSWTELRAVLATRPDISIVREEGGYLHAEARTRWLRFVDDLEFWANPAAGVIELRSASRLGREDFGVNRERIEGLRAAYRQRPAQ